MAEQMKSINLTKVAASSAPFSSLVKGTALKLMDNPYMSVGDFFKGLTNDDLTALLFMVELMETDGQSLENLIVLTEMLSHAEGVTASTDGEIASNVHFFCNLIAVVSLNRKGMIDVVYENMSFGSDMRDKPIVKAM